MLTRTPLFSGLEPDARETLASCFTPHAFERQELLFRAGDGGRYLGVLLEGKALVQARLDDRAFTVEVLEPGAVFGEIAFFDPQMSRTADVIGDTRGLAALLPYSEYHQLVRAESPAAEALERQVLSLLARRLKSTDDKLAELLQATRQGGFLKALGRLFGFGGAR